MMRYINIGEQITDGNHDFAFFDTVVDKFVTIFDKHVFSSVQNFDEACIDDASMSTDGAARLRALIPKEQP